ncbi:hypothetical protein PAECIP111893_01974 [Paenibacillus plantiphilus]|uniref:DUF4129 domain-containing protein n=1 Tax=Paenibacillus plantiphilus TaxID=2905650 RepID=A0ABM9C6Q1_9BACL|nr:DUF4129 domain-containing protein [Paenibacillus plantiphilus]CAH1203464.1 hypothetical protein PAECIP111893_01974 [Paenibacillus plantiphilus]
MTEIIRRSLLVLLRGTIELVLYLPIFIWFHVLLLPAGSGWLWLAPMLIAYPAGYWLNRKLSFHHFAMVLLFSIIPAALYGMLVYGLSYIGIMTIIATTIGMYRGQMMALFAWSERFLPWQYGVGLFTYFAVSLLFGHKPLFQPYFLPLLVFGLVSIVLTLYTTNKSYVNAESLTGEMAPKVEKVVKRQNRMFVLIVIAVAVLIVFTYQLQWIFTELWQVIAAWLNSWEFEKYESGEALVPDIPVSPPSEETVSSARDYDIFNYIMYFIFMLIRVLIIGGILVFIIYIRHLPNLIRYLLKLWKQLIQREQVTVEEGYVDEIEDIQKPKRIWAFLSGRNKEHRLKWTNLQDNESRIRFLYRQWLAIGAKRGFIFKPHFTPQENGAELITHCNEIEAVWAHALLDQYSDVRYGEKKAQEDKLQHLIDTQSKNKR